MIIEHGFENESEVIDRTAQRFWEVASVCRGRLAITGMNNVQHVLAAIGVLIAIENEAMYRPMRHRQLTRLHELHIEMIIGQKRASQ